MSEVISLEGPVELENGHLTIRIPLEHGGAQLAPLTKGIGEIQGDDLVVVIQPWLAEKLGIGPDSIAIVDNAEGKFRVTRSAANDA
jgi:hypothetical protein